MCSYQKKEKSFILPLPHALALLPHKLYVFLHRAFTTPFCAFTTQDNILYLHRAFTTRFYVFTTGQDYIHFVPLPHASLSVSFFPYRLFICLIFLLFQVSVVKTARRTSTTVPGTTVRTGRLVWTVSRATVASVRPPTPGNFASRTWTNAR